MPVGEVAWFHADKGFGFIQRADGGPDVFVHASVLPPEAKGCVASGTRLEFEMADSSRGPQALSVRLLNPPKPRAVNTGTDSEQLVRMLEDVIRLLDRTSGWLREDKPILPSTGVRLSTMLRALAARFDPG